MNWIIGTFASSIGKKLVMAVTGLIFCSFLAVHLIGNLTIYLGKNSFNSYSDHLHSYGLILNALELGLLAFALIHIFFATIIYFENLRARPHGYVMKKGTGGETISSRTAPYTGLYILIFVIIHLIMFTFRDRSAHNVFEVVAGTFQNSLYIIFYVFSVIVVAFHVKHGLWSGFQTLGLNHPKYMPAIRIISLVFSLTVGVGLGSIPVFIAAIQ
ncbi:succinate dehydrogenase cytochrome b subunit [Thermodesulfobacteriota bacterium]